MASKENANPLTCSICLEPKDERTPRALPCLHSFCEACLLQWHNNRVREGRDTDTQIECPVCRSKARLPRRGIQSFPIDFNVQEIAALAKRRTVSAFCQVCEHQGKSESAKSFCKNCSRRLCGPCALAHRNIALFSTHTIVHAICQLHAIPLDYVCVTCSSAVCVDCMFSDRHKNHTILDSETGLKEVKTKLEMMKGELGDKVAACNAAIESKIRVCITKQCSSEEQLKEAGEHLKTTIDEIVAETIEQHKKEHREQIDDIFRDYKDDTKKTESVITEVENLFQGDSETILLNLGKVTGAVQHSIDSISATHLSLPEPGHVSTDCCCLDGVDEAMEALKRCTLVCDIEGALCRSPDGPVPELIQEFRCGGDTGLDLPWTVNVTPTGDAVVCSWDGGRVHILKKDGTDKALQGTRNVITSCVSNNDIYLVNSEGTRVSKVSEGRILEILRLDPPIPRPRAMAIHEGSAYFFHENRVLKYSLVDQTSNEIFRIETKSPGSLICTPAGGSSVLALTDRGTHMVIICDLEGNEVRRFGGRGENNGQLKRPNGIARMANGNLLVADRRNDRIVEYDPDGTFVRNLLTRADGIHYPSDVACFYPFIWVTEHVAFGEVREGSVKVFMYK